MSASSFPVLTIDIGGTHVKILVSGETEKREFDSGPKLTPQQMVAGVKKAAAGWKYEHISIGYPGPVSRGRPVIEPHNLAPGWVGFDYEKAFGKPVRLVNDAALQALGSYREGKMLFLGLGTGLGSCMIAEGIVVPMELAHVPYKKGTYEDYVGVRGKERLGKKKWRQEVENVTKILRKALLPDEVVLGGGNVKDLKELPEGCREGDNANAFLGGFRLWEGRESDATTHSAQLKKAKAPAAKKARPAKKK